MGKDGEVKSVNAGKPPFILDPKSLTNQANVHVYPEWTAMQAYYGRRVPMPPYYNSQAASGHASHPYVWAPPQTMMSPYGAPYAAMYAHGSVYAHPAVPPGSNVQGVSLSPAATNPSSVETPTKSSGNTDRDLVKKSKAFDALETSLGNGNTDNAEGEVYQSLSKSSSAAEGSRSDENTSRTNQSKRKRGREATCTTVVAVAGDQKPEIQAGMNVLNTASNKRLDITVAAVGVPASLVRPLESHGLTTVLELKNLSSLNLTSAKARKPNTVTSPESWLEDDGEVKKEKRKQSNRDSARRSRLRKQAETEELAEKVDALNADNESLKYEINRLTESSDRLKIKNSSLMEKLKKARVGRMEEMIMNQEEAVTTKNLLSTLARDVEEENVTYEKKAGEKLYQLQDARPRTDAIVAS